MNYDYKTSGTCSREIHFVLDDDDVITDVVFDGGCNGNLKGISRLVSGQKAADICRLLRGTVCKDKGTSCPDQLALAIEKALAAKAAGAK